MVRANVKSARLVAVFLLGLLLFNYPFLALFNGTGDLLGIPLPYAYIFSAWALVIALLALIAERSN